MYYTCRLDYFDSIIWIYMILYFHSLCVCMHALCLWDVICILYVEMLYEQFGPVLLWVVGSNFDQRWKAVFSTPANQPSGPSALSQRELSQEGEVVDGGPAKEKAKTNPAEGTTSNQGYRIIIILLGWCKTGGEGEGRDEGSANCTVIDMLYGSCKTTKAVQCSSSLIRHLD